MPGNVLEHELDGPPVAQRFVNNIESQPQFCKTSARVGSLNSTFRFCQKGIHTYFDKNVACPGPVSTFSPSRNPCTSLSLSLAPSPFLPALPLPRPLGREPPSREQHVCPPTETKTTISDQTLPSVTRCLPPALASDSARCNPCNRHLPTIAVKTTGERLDDAAVLPAFLDYAARREADPTFWLSAMRPVGRTRAAPSVTGWGGGGGSRGERSEEGLMH
jgi:hypothetical protein